MLPNLFITWFDFRGSLRTQQKHLLTVGFDGLLGSILWPQNFGNVIFGYVAYTDFHFFD